VVERRSAIRAAVVWDAVQAVLLARQGNASEAGRPLEVLDLGGGTGGLAVRIAELGHHVVVVDPSPDALASLERRAADAGMVAGKMEQGDGSVRGVLGDAASLPDVVPAASVDVVVCHGVLEVVDVPSQALDAAAAALAPGGTLSLLAAQRSAAVFARAIGGHVADARALLADPDGRWGSTDPMPRRFTRDQLVGLLEAAGFTVGEIRGIRVFADHLSSTVVESEPGAAEALRALEAEVSTHADFAAIATQLHLLATRP
jgi:ubiquinone/menaquinone biosynthesis C-methylase UbiE